MKQPSSKCQRCSAIFLFLATISAGFGFKSCFAQGVSDHEPMNVSPIISAIHLIFEAAIPDFQILATISNPTSIFSARISISASIVARTIVSCLRNAHARRLLQEPPDMGIVSLLNQEGHLFLNTFLEPSFSCKIESMEQHDSPNGAKTSPFGCYFSEKTQNRRSVFGLRRRVRIAYEPVPYIAQGHPKIEEKKGHVLESLF